MGLVPCRPSTRRPNSETPVQALQSTSLEPPSRIAVSDRIEARVEAVCQKGCRQVRRDIETLHQGGEIAESRGIPRGERALLLAELEDIMAVYGDTCPLD